MRNVLLTSCLAALPSLGGAQSLCGLPAPADGPEPLSHPSITLPPPAPAVLPAATPPRPATPVANAPANAAEPVAGQPAAPAAGPQPAATVPVLRHIAGAGARLEELGERGGLRTVIARSGEEFMLLSVAPGGQAAVAGLTADLSLEQLRRIAGAGLTELGERHGLLGVLVRSGAQFQVFYATPDGSRVIPGVMWDASGRNVTREQISTVQGAIPTVTIGDVPSTDPLATQPTRPGRQGASARLAAPPRAGIAAAERAFAGRVGNPEAPELQMFIDPQCGYSVQALQRLQPLVASGRLRLSVIPVAILDGGNGGASTRTALAMLSRPADQMVEAWGRGDLSGVPSPDAVARLQGNMEAAREIALRGTPTFLWRRADGSEGRQEGLPGDVAAFAAAVQGR